MTGIEFVSAIRTQTVDSSVASTSAVLENVPGKGPTPHIVRLSDWYRGLDETNKNMAMLLMKEAAEQSVFAFLCILDGVKVFENGQKKGRLELYYVDSDKTLLNDPEGEELHNLFEAGNRGS